ncbi:Mrp/NBP35 family ATP-binding protein [bacterium]|nr:Mrp/NBP35 family ATP-binding protein [bacterium]
MSEGCTHDCSSCGKNCSERKGPVDLKVAANAESKIKKVIAVVSGKGGVGKSFVTSMLAVLANRQGKRAAILDADITGPSIPKAFGLRERAQGCDTGILPVYSDGGIPIMSLNLLLANDTDPVVWRGPILAGTVKQFWQDVIWGEVDYMFIDMPPGTGDVPLTVFQSLPIDGVIVVASPQELVGMIVEKAINMLKMMNIPVLALVENMSYFVIPNCEEKHNIFGDSHIEDIAKKFSIGTVCRVPINPKLASATDNGAIEDYAEEALVPVVAMLGKL